MYGYIYKTTNLINGRIYIGQHKHDKWDNKYYGSGKILISAIKKYGIKNFKCELIECCETKQEMNNREKYWIKFYSKTNNCYNITEGGEGRTAPHSQEAEAKTGINKSYISQLCNGKGKQCFGYTWQYVEEKENEK